MQKSEIKTIIESIRKDIMESDLDAATEKLTALAAHFGDDAHDEAVTLTADWNRLEREMRSSLIHESEARVRRNRLIDQILDFARDLQEGKPPVKNTTSSGSNKTWIYAIGGIALLAIILFAANHFMNTEPAQPEQEAVDQTLLKNCADKMIEGKALYATNKFKAAQKTFTEILKRCPEKEEAQEYLEKLFDQKPKVVTETKPSSTQQMPVQKEAIKPSTPPTQSASRTPSKTSTNSSGSVKENRTAPSNTGNYQELLVKGVASYEAKKYESAYELLSAAKKINDSEEVRKYTRILEESLYNKYRVRGMDYYNAGNYSAAKKEFLVAQGYKDFSAIRGLINKCNKKLGQ